MFKIAIQGMYIAMMLMSMGTCFACLFKALKNDDANKSAGVCAVAGISLIVFLTASLSANELL